MRPEQYPGLVMRAALAALLLGVLALVLWLAFQSRPTPEAVQPSVLAAAPFEQQLGPGPMRGASEERSLESSLAAPPETMARESQGDAAVEPTGKLVVHARAVEDGQAIEGVLVRLRPSALDESPTPWIDTRVPEPWRRGVLADAHGRAEFEIPAGEALTVFTLGMSGWCAAGEVAAPVVSPGGSAEVVLSLETQPDYPFFARVSDARSRQPIPEAKIRSAAQFGFGHADHHAGHLEGPSEFRVDPQGLFRGQGTSWEQRYACVHAAGYSLRVVSLAGAHGTPESALEIPLEPGAGLSVRVTESGAPREGLDVRASCDSWLLLLRESELGVVHDTGRPRWDAFTGIDGRCRLADLPGEIELQLEVFGSGSTPLYEMTWRSPEPGIEGELEIELAAGTTLHGKVVDQEGRPVTGLRVWLLAESVARQLYPWDREKAREAECDEQGAFEFERTSSGTWILGLAPLGPLESGDPEEQVSRLSQWVEVPAGAEQMEVVLSVYRGLTIRGTVLDPSGAPAAGARVGARSASPAAWFSAESGPDGSFALGGLVPGELALTAQSGGALHATYSDEVRAAAGDRGVVLHLKLGSSIAGRLTLAGAPFDGQAEVLLSVYEPGAELVGLTLDQAHSGRFAFQGLEPGEYGLAARSPDGRIGLLPRIQVGPGESVEGLEVMLLPGATLRVRNASEKSSVAAWPESEGALLGYENLAPGRSVSFVVPAGRLVVRLKASEGEAAAGAAEAREVSILEGEALEIFWP